MIGVTSQFPVQRCDSKHLSGTVLGDTDTIKYRPRFLFTCGRKTDRSIVLSLIGGIIYLLTGILVAVAAAFIGSVVALAGYGVGGLAVAIVGAIGLVSGIIMVIGAIMMNSSVKSRVTTGSILVLVFTLVGALFTVGGFVIGFILALIGSILGLVWKPAAPMAPPPVPPS